MIIDLSPAPWMILPGLLTMIGLSAGFVCVVDWICRKYSKIDSDK